MRYRCPPFYAYVEMCHLNETLYSCGIACSAEGQKTAAGNYLVNILLANICKQNVTRFPYESKRKKLHTYEMISKDEKIT